MSTKTVINTNMPSTRGISIIIDQDQMLLQKLQQHDGMQQDEAPIRIYQQNIDINNTTTTKATTIPQPTNTVKTKTSEADVCKKMSLTSQTIPAKNTSTTFMHGQINDDAVGDDDDDQRETSFNDNNKMSVETTKLQQCTTTTTYPLLLQIGSQDDLQTITPTTTTTTTIAMVNATSESSERFQIGAELLGKSRTITPTMSRDSGVAEDEDDDDVADDDESNGTTKLIKSGQLWLTCMGGDVDSSGPSRLEEVGLVATANSLSQATGISGAVSDNSHVVKIQIQATNKPTEKQVTVVKLNEFSDLGPSDEKMVQKSQSVHCAGALNGVGVASTPNSSGTTVTELNVGNPNYLYYMMSSGQFSPCDTLDSGTGSDLESNGNTTNNAQLGDVNVPKLELHLKTTKIRVNGSTGKSLEAQNRNSEHQRASSLTDSEESEASSLSCDSLHSSEFMRAPKISGSTLKVLPVKTPLGTFLPDSLLRDIRGRKLLNDDDDPYEHMRHSPESVSEQEQYVELKSAPCRPILSKNNGKRTSLPNKTFVLNPEDGSFEDTKMNSMPRRYEADKYYNFHVKEHENFRSFAHNSEHEDSSDSISESCFDTKSLHDDAFAGYKDIRCGSGTSTIRSSKGTVRGVKNRVRNGIATFLQLQQPNVKNYKEKDYGKVVLYTTSMGIIRDTYAKCSNMKQILRTLLVKFEERDVFMSIEYQQEIKERMHSETIKVPQLFVEGQHIGDAETVERLNESGELRQLLKPYKSISSTYTCQTCGGYRLLPCPSCNGSKKSVHRNHFTAEFVALKCMNCDEVGLVKCHNC